MMEEQFKFEDIFDLNALQELMDALAQTFEVGLGVRTPSGERIIRDSFYCPFCADVVWSTEEGRRLCDSSDKKIIAYAGEEPYICRCGSGGLIDAGIEIMIEGVHIASILVGQIRLEEDITTEEEYRAAARRLNLDEEEYLKKVNCVPVKSQKKLDGILKALTIIAGQLSQLGYSNLHQRTIIGTLENQESRLQALADKDAMTNIWNRRKFEAVMEQYAERMDMRISLISGDANNLKLMNDIFGHEAGDRMLHSIARKMQEMAKDDWIVARCGGDEFHVLLPGAPLATAQDYCSRVQRNCKNDLRMNLPLSISFGAAEWDRDSETLQECFQRADAQMYENKKAMKKEENLLDYILERLYDRQYLYREVVSMAEQMAYEFAVHLGFNREGAERVRTAAKYQDVGMIQLPEHFIIKGQSKTEEEVKAIKEHVIRGYNMALKFESTYQIAEFILCAHENWDGNGYPRARKGQEIPLESRMIRIIDRYCYWVTPKPNGTNLSYEETIRKLRAEAGLMFDPDMVEWFISFLEKED